MYSRARGKVEPSSRTVSALQVFQQTRVLSSEYGNSPQRSMGWSIGRHLDLPLVRRYSIQVWGLETLRASKRLVSGLSPCSGRVARVHERSRQLPRIRVYMGYNNVDYCETYFKKITDSCCS